MVRTVDSSRGRTVGAIPIITDIMAPCSYKAMAAMVSDTSMILVIVFFRTLGLHMSLGRTCEEQPW